MIKRLVFMLLPTLVIGGSVWVGLYAGEFYTLLCLRWEIDRVQHEQHLEAVISEQQRAEVSRVYLDAAAAARDLDHYSWLAPTVPAPFVGVAPQPGAHDNVQINALGCRSNREIRLPKPPGVVRLFLTGGSVAYGAGAPDQARTIGGYLEARLNEQLAPGTMRVYEVFTLANPGWASTHERLMTINRILDWEPDLVLAFSGFNDVHYGQGGHNILWFRIPQEELYWNIIHQVFVLSKQAPLPPLVSSASGPVEPRLVAQRLLRNASLTAYALKQKGDIPLAFCLQPNLACTQKPLTPREQNRRRNTDYIRACFAEIHQALAGVDQTNFHLIDLRNIFDQQSVAEDIFLDNCHFGDRGNALIAEGLYRQIQSWLPGSRE